MHCSIENELFIERYNRAAKGQQEPVCRIRSLPHIRGKLFGRRQGFVKNDKQDRRSQRTRGLVNSAMFDLMFERDYDAITIQDILDRSGIGRSTFYSHYFDKDDVLTSIVEQMLATFDQEFSRRNPGEGLIPALALFKHGRENHRHLRAMLRGRAGDVLWEAAHAALSRTIAQNLTVVYPGGNSSSILNEDVARYVAGSFLQLLKWWIVAELPYPPEEMENMFNQLAMPGVRCVFEGKTSNSG
jgi:AcrR family transcriptional regulator